MSKSSKKSILGSMGSFGRVERDSQRDDNGFQKRSSMMSNDDDDYNSGSRNVSGGGGTGRLRTFRKKEEEPVSNGLDGARRTNFRQRASMMQQQQADVQHQQRSDLQDDYEDAGTADEVKQQVQRRDERASGNGNLPDGLAGGGYLDQGVASMNLQDPSSDANRSNREQNASSNGGVIAAATGGVTAAIAGVGSLISGGGQKDDIERTTDATQDPDVPDNDLEKYEDETPAQQGGKGDATALIDEEKKQQQRQTSKPANASTQRELRPNKVKPLSAVQRHYLLKALVSIQMQVEWSELEKLGGLTQYGYPFSLERPKLKRVKNTKLQLDGDFAKGDFAEAADDPYADVDEDEARRQENLIEPLILRHMFHVHLHTFPGLDKAPEKYWQRLIQVFFDEMAARNFSSSVERSETTARHFYTLAMTRYLGGFFARGVGVRGEANFADPGKGDPGSERWGVGKQWGKGTVKRGLDKPARPEDDLMERIDSLFDGREGDVWRRAGKETTRVKHNWRAFKEMNIETENGLEETMAYLDVGNMRNLPTNYRNAEEYARHHAAYIFHTLFVNSPNADSFYNILRGIHLLFPYWGAKQLLKVANAQTMISGILNLLLARPAGSKSLVQRIFVSVIGGQASTFNKEYVQPLRKEINDGDLTSKLEDYVKRGNRPEGKALRNRAIRTGQDVLTTILLYASGPQLSQSKKNEVMDLQDAYARSPYRGTLDAAYPSNSLPGKATDRPKVNSWTNDRDEQREALKYAMLKLYLRDLLRRRDRDEACKMASGSLLPTIIKESLDTVFYGPIKSIAEHSDLSARLGDLQAFFDDIIKTRKNSKNTLPDWIALTARHENSLYFLFHECAAIIQPFTQWLQSGADFMALSTTDPNHPANRKAKNIEVNLELLLQDASISDQDVDDIIAEADQLATYVKWQKVWYELEMRKNFLLGHGAAVPASGLCEDDIPSGAMRNRLEDVDGMLLDLMRQERVEAEDGVIHSDVRGTEVRDFPWAWFDAVDPLHQHLQGTDPTAMSYEPKSASAKLPSMKHTRKALEAFQFALLQKMPAWKEGDAKGVPATPRHLKAGAANRSYAANETISSSANSTKSPSVSAQAPSKSRFKMPFGRG